MQHQTPEAPMQLTQVLATAALHPTASALASSPTPAAPDTATSHQQETEACGRVKDCEERSPQTIKKHPKTFLKSMMRNQDLMKNN